MKIARLAVVLFILLSGCKRHKDEGPIPTPGPGPATYDASGVWLFTSSQQTYTPGTCGFSSNPFIGYGGSVTLAQSGNSVTMASGGVVYSGTVSGSSYSVSATYTDSGWTHTDTITFNLTSANAGTGTLSWNLSASGLGCNGSNSVSGTKQP